MKTASVCGRFGIVFAVLVLSNVACESALAKEPVLDLASTSEAVEFGPQADLKTQFPETSVKDLFNVVATRIRFEPYAGVLRGAAGTAVAGSGNSLDQSILLASLLRRQGYEVRYVQGSLGSKNRSSLIRGLFPPQIPELSHGEEYAPFDPYTDPALLKSVADHYWVEVRQGDRWIPMDPSFPRAVLGEAYGVAAARMDQPADDAYATITIRYKRELLSKKVTTAAEFEERVADIALRPISLVEVMAPLVAPEKEGKKSSPMGGFGGALSGKSPAVEEAAVVTDEQDRVVGAGYDWRFTVPKRGMSSGSTVVLNDKPKSGIAREWLEFEIHSPGLAPRKVTRTLFHENLPGSAEKPVDFSHYTISIFNGPVSQKTVKEQIAKANAKTSLSSVKQALNAMEASPKTSSTSEALAIEDKLGTTLMHILNLRLAAEIDASSDMAAYPNGVALSRGMPRIYISSMVSGESGYSLAMDLRLDELTAIPFPGAPSRLAQLYQTGRGFQNSVLEGKILEHFTGKQAVTTARLMSAAREQSVELFSVTTRNLKQFTAQAKLPQEIESVVRPYLENDGEVIIAGEAIEIDGRNRWGWWAMDSASGRAIGVMDDGLHQAMIETTIDTEQIGLSPMTGFVIGGIVGATSASMIIAAKILQYGAVTDALIADVEKFLKGIADGSCPGTSAGVSAGVSFAGDCMKIETGVGVDVLTMNFCGKYADGFNCASGLILGALKGEPPGLSPSLPSF